MVQILTGELDPRDIPLLNTLYNGDSTPRSPFSRALTLSPSLAATAVGAEPTDAGSGDGAAATANKHVSGYVMTNAAAAIKGAERSWLQSQLSSGSLNLSQQAAVLEVLAGSSRVQLIQGPPGTGGLIAG